MFEMIVHAITFFLMNFTATFPLLGLVVACFSVLVKRPGWHGVFQTLLSWFLLLGTGAAYIFNGIMHTVFRDFSASRIGWEDSGFQPEVGFASFGMGLVAILASPKRMPDSLKFAALITPAVFLWGAGWGHIVEIVEHGNFSPDNAGTVLYTDIFVPILGFVLYLGSRLTRPGRNLPRGGEITEHAA